MADKAKHYSTSLQFCGLRLCSVAAEVLVGKVFILALRRRILRAGVIVRFVAAGVRRVGCVACFNERSLAQGQLLISMFSQRLFGVADNAAHSRHSKLQDLCPTFSNFWLYRIQFVQHHDKRLLQGTHDMVDKRGWQMQQWMPCIHYNDSHITSFQHTPKLAPNLQVLLVSRRVPTAIRDQLFHISKPLLETLGLAEMKPATADFIRPRGTSGHEVPDISRDVQFLKAQLLLNGTAII
mmetsp:Transcript_102828/g.178791  ORF Transcript_102828/g.178791 Transcript_102828/m.178791 type:complete len:238 (-) Transcript_102828:375-1088(-)